MVNLLVMEVESAALLGVRDWLPIQIPNPPPINPFRGTPLWGVVVGFGVALLVLSGPALVVAGLVMWWVWWMGWPASRIRNLVLGWSVCVLAGAVVRSPIEAWRTGYERIVGGDWTGLADTLVLEILAGLILAWIGWWSVETTRRSGRSQERGERFERRQTLHRSRSARRRGQRNHTPLVAADRVNGHGLVLGQRIEEETRLRPSVWDMLSARHPWWVTLAPERLAQHLAVVGITGSGKTWFLRRLALAWLEAQWAPTRQARNQAGSGAGGPSSQILAGSPNPRPLCIFIDAKGGVDAGADAEAWCEAFQALGIASDRTLAWPFWGRLDMWQMPGRDLVESLDAIAREREEHPYYARQRRRLLQLVCLAPDQPTPSCGPELVERFDPRWLRAAWEGRSEELDEIKALAKGAGRGGSAINDAWLLYKERFETLGRDFDAGMPLSDLDALYCTIPGTVARNEAMAKARVLVELLLTELAQNPREVLFVLDEFSAVSEALALHEVVERVRAMGGRVVVSAQTWEGFGATDDLRNRLLGDLGTKVVMQTSAPEPFSMMAGSRRRLEATRKLGGDDGGGPSARVQDQFLLPPDRVRHLGVGEFALFATGGSGAVTWGYVPPTKLPALAADGAELADEQQQAPRVEGERLSNRELDGAMERATAGAGPTDPDAGWDPPPAAQRADEPGPEQWTGWPGPEGWAR